MPTMPMNSSFSRLVSGSDGRDIGDGLPFRLRRLQGFVQDISWQFVGRSDWNVRDHSGQGNLGIFATLRHGYIDHSLALFDMGHIDWNELANN